MTTKQMAKLLITGRFAIFVSYWNVCATYCVCRKHL